MKQDKAFLHKLKHCAEFLQQQTGKDALLLHHNDTDGLTSGSIIRRIFNQLGINFQAYCLEKPYPVCLETLLRQADTEFEMVTLVDFGSGMLKFFSENLQPSQSLLLFDHHRLEDVTVPSHWMVVNPTAYGYSGMSDASAGTVAALLAERAAPFWELLSPVGLLGAYGDGQYRAEEKFLGLNAELLHQCANFDSAKGEGDELELEIGTWQKARDLKRWIDSLGSFGYLHGGPDIALMGLESGFQEGHIQKAQHFQQEFESALQSFLTQTDIRNNRNISYFTLSDSFSEMGVKTVGLVCEEILQHDLFSNQHIIIGFQRIPEKIPGMGELCIDQVKVSGRVSELYLKKIQSAKAPGLDILMPIAARRVNGFSDACHPHAGAVTVPIGSEQAFIESMAKELAHHAT